MKQKDLLPIVGVALVTAIISLILSSILFGSPKQRTAKTPVVESIGTSLPDVKNDPKYKSIFNSQALDPTQPVIIDGNNQNNKLFNSTP